MNSCGSGQDVARKFCEKSNELSGFIKGEESVEHPLRIKGKSHRSLHKLPHY
jgi:hypothetical protein